jgi:hypothetical protein
VCRTRRRGARHDGQCRRLDPKIRVDGDRFRQDVRTLLRGCECRDQFGAGSRIQPPLDEGGDSLRINPGLGHSFHRSSFF